MKKGIYIFLLNLMFLAISCEAVYALGVGAVADRISQGDVVNIVGLTSPWAEIAVVLPSEDDKVIAAAEIEDHGRFEFEFKYDSATLSRLEVFGADQFGLTSRVPIGDFLKGKVLMPPTIVNDKADKGVRNLAIQGMTHPNAMVNVSIRRENSTTADVVGVQADSNGLWKLNKSDLQAGKYVASATSSYENLVSRPSQDIYFEIALADVPTEINTLWQNFWGNLSLDPTWVLIVFMPLLWLHLRGWTGWGALLAFVGLVWPLFGFKRRPKVGVVYDALTKAPIEYALVRIREFTSKKTIAVDITNSKGEFNFDLKEGDYLIDVKAGGYIFPSQLIKRKGTDGQYANIYHGEKISLSSRATVIVSIPLDPLEMTSQSWFYIKNFLRRFGSLISWVWLALCIVWALLLFVYYPDVLHGAIVGYYSCLVVYLIGFGTRLGVLRSSVSDKTGNRLSNILVTVYSWPDLELIATRVSDSDGKFALELDRGEYQVRVFDEQYQLVKVIEADDGIIRQTKSGWVRMSVIVELI